MDLKFCFDKNGRLVAGSAQKIAISKIEDYSSLPGKAFDEKIYLLYNGFKEPKKCECGNALKFYNFKKGYYSYCSNKCKADSKDYKEKKKKSNLEKYGVESTNQLESMKEKAKATIQEKYGVDNIFKNPSIRQRITEKRILSNIDNRNKSENIKKVKDMLKDRDLEFISVKISPTENPIYTIRCQKHDLTWDWSLDTIRTEHKQEKPYCIACYKEKQSQAEKDVLHFIQSIYSGTIIENSFDIIPPKELDIFLPDLNLAIEYNGLVWHSNKFLGDDYHLTKYNLCKERGISLIQIWENEWTFKQAIVKSILTAKINPGLNKKIYARKTELKEIPYKEYKEFLDSNHLQGYCQASLKYGLYYENELIQVMSFSKSRFRKGNYWEIIRESSKLGYFVVGGKERLLKYFEDTIKSSIISYSDKRYFSGKSYERLGFKKEKDSAPNYYYIKRLQVFNRINFQKHKLEKIKDFKFDTNLTEKENMLNNKYYYIYDCGNSVYIKNIPLK